MVLRSIRSVFRRSLDIVNKELWLILSLVAIAAVLNFVVAPHRILLGLYTFPTIYSAYFFGRRHATLTAVASSLIVILVVHSEPSLFTRPNLAPSPGEKWYELALWAGILIVTAYTMGTLYDNKESRIRELRETYHGILLILPALHFQGRIHSKSFLSRLNIFHRDRHPTWARFRAG